MAGGFPPYTRTVETLPPEAAFRARSTSKSMFREPLENPVWRNCQVVVMLVLQLCQAGDYSALAVRNEREKILHLLRPLDLFLYSCDRLRHVEALLIEKPISFIQCGNGLVIEAPSPKADD